MNEKIIIRDLECQAIIGCLPEERVTPQTILISAELECELSRAAQSDQLSDTVNYADLAQRIVKKTQSCQAQLLEYLADKLLDLCLESPLVHKATIQIKKPQAIPGAQYAAVEFCKVR